ncbi:serine/threonine-protein kinase HT1-like [Asparagus officinalis]|nr:serine/threonine-protein kinase HT1-like [Asparagus officinalis]
MGTLRGAKAAEGSWFFELEVPRTFLEADVFLRRFGEADLEEEEESQVLNGNPYNRKCDVYSFGICLWEIYCCDMPYPDLSFSEVTSAVVRQNLRPEIPRCCPSSLANVMKRCWDANPDKRPEMDEVVTMLEAIDTSKGGGMIPVDQRSGCLWFLGQRRGP